MKNQRISFRLSPYNIARGLHIIRQLEPTYQITSLNDIVKVAYHDYLAKMNLAKSDEVPASILQEINNFISSRSSNQSDSVTLDDIIELNNQFEASEQSIETVINKSPESNQLEDVQTLADLQPKPSDFDDPNNTESDISSVNDFSPPENWKQP